ncbi:MAG: nuclear transport factor 2 family protein [Nannocystaceae bacterium]|nr:nuclear transport factor 2 family protein [Nannocystaceae bacterium]
MGAVLTGLLALQSGGCGAPQFSDADAVAIEGVLTQQREAWNVGDIDAFMAAYLAGPELVFTSGAAVRRGHAQALARYRAKYVDGGTMGQLQFSDLEVTGLSPDAAVVLGRWALTQTEQAGDGVFTLVFVRRNGGWKILHDHTSVTPEGPEDPPPSAEDPPRSDSQ